VGVGRDSALIPPATSFRHLIKRNIAVVASQISLLCNEGCGRNILIFESKFIEQDLYFSQGNNK
jgi:hypothetical protein